MSWEASRHLSPFTSNTIIPHNNILVPLFSSLSLLFLSISQQGLKVRLVGRVDLQAKSYHAFNATTVSQRAGGPPAALSAVVSHPRRTLE